MPYYVLKISKILQSPVYFGMKFSAVTKVDIEVTGAAVSQNHFTPGKTRSTKISAAWERVGIFLDGMVISDGFTAFINANTKDFYFF